MPSISELGLHIGDKVAFETEIHGRLGEEPLPRVKESFVEEIVGLDRDAVYLYPWTEKLAAFTRVQNTRTGEIDALRAVRTTNSAGQEVLHPVLNEDERLVIGMSRGWQGFRKVETDLHTASFDQKF